MERLEQAKKRDHKIYVTDVAVNKISRTFIPFLSEKQNELIYKNHVALLQTAKDKNDSNEVAFLFDLNTGESCIKMGDESEVNIFLNPNAVSMSAHSQDKTLFLVHNHPSTQDFSYSDIGVFLLNDSFGGISVASNLGDVHILFKSDRFDFYRAYEYISFIRNEYDHYDSEADRAIVKRFLKNSEKLGILQY